MRSKVKSRSYYDAADQHPHSMSLPSNNCLLLIVSEVQPCQHFNGQGHYSKAKGQIKITPWHCRPTSSNQCLYQVSTSHILWFLRYNLEKILKVKVTIARSKHQDIAAHPDTIGESNTHTALNGCGVKSPLGGLFMGLTYRLNVYLKP